VASVYTRAGDAIAFHFARAPDQERFARHVTAYLERTAHAPSGDGGEQGEGHDAVPAGEGVAAKATGVTARTDGEGEGKADGDMQHAELGRGAWRNKMKAMTRE